MGNFSFFQATSLFRELGEPAPPAGGDPAGGPPGGEMPPPMGGGGGMPPMGGDPMGGGEQPSPGQPIDVKTLPASDVWKMLEKIIKDEKYSKFFDEINIVRREAPTVHSKQQPKKSSLQK